MSRYVDIAEELLQAIADGGSSQPGAALPSVRGRSRADEGATPRDRRRARTPSWRGLGAVVDAAPRRLARVAPGRRAAARARG